MALKKVVDTEKRTYLNKRFEDDLGISQYSSSLNLVAWYRFAGYNESDVISMENNLSNGLYVIVTTGDTNNWSDVQSGNVSGGSASNTPTPGDVFEFDGSSAQSTIPAGEGKSHGTVAPLVSPENLSTNSFYDASGNNVFYDTSGNPVSPPTYGVQTTVSSERVPRFSSHKMGEITYKFAAFNSPSNPVGDHVTIGTPTQWNEVIGVGAKSTKKMSFGAMVQVDTHATENVILSIGKSTAPVTLRVGASGSIELFIETSAGTASYQTETGLIKENHYQTGSTFHHVVVTYDASYTSLLVGDSIQSIPSFYVDGVLYRGAITTRHNGSTNLSSLANATYSGISTAADAKAKIGIRHDENSLTSFRGKIGEVLIWNSVLSDEEVKLIYDVSRSRFTRNEPVSGFLGNSARIQSIENLNYHDVHGKFDDMRTIDFIDPRQEAVIKFNRVPYDAQTITITDNLKTVDPVTSTTSNPTRVFEFQRGVILVPGNVEVNIRGARTPAQVAKAFVDAVNSQTNNGSWTFYAKQTKPNEVKIIRGRIDKVDQETVKGGSFTVGAKYRIDTLGTTNFTSIGALSNHVGRIFYSEGVGSGDGTATHLPSTISTSASERFVEITKIFQFKPLPRSVYPSLDIADSKNLGSRKDYGKTIRSDIEIIRPVTKQSIPPKVVHNFNTDPFNEANASVAFGFEEGAEGLSPERDQSSDFYVSGSSPVISPSSIRDKKQIVIDIPVRESLDISTGMAYYNFDLSRWEKIGKDPLNNSGGGHTARRRLNQFNLFMQSHCIGFTPSTSLECHNTTSTFSSGSITHSFSSYFEVTGSETNKIAHNGKILGAGTLASPTNVFGFPVAAKYHATGSQHIDMGSKISKPFVLEKVLIETKLMMPQVNKPMPAQHFLNVNLANGILGVGDTVTLTSTDGTTKVYTAADATNASARQFFKGIQFNNVSLITSLAECIIHENGHGGKIIPLQYGPEFLLLIQAESGTEGETAVTINISNDLDQLRDDSGQGGKFTGGGASKHTGTTGRPLTGSSTVVDLDTCAFFLLNQRTAATGEDLDQLPSISVGNGSARLGPSAGGNEVVEAIAPAGSIPSSIKLTSEVDTPTVNVDTMRDLITYSKLTISHHGHDNTQLDSGAKDLRTDSDMVVSVSAEDANIPWGMHDHDDYTCRAAGDLLVGHGDLPGDYILFDTPDNTVRVYTMDPRDPAGSGVATGQLINGVVSVNLFGKTTAEHTAIELETAINSPNGHNGKLKVTRSGNVLRIVGSTVSKGNHMFTTNSSGVRSQSGGKAYKITAPCRSVSVQKKDSFGRVEGSPSLIKLNNSYFEIKKNASQKDFYELGTSPASPQYFHASRGNLGRTMADIQSGRAISSENASLKSLYTMRGTANSDLKITAFEVDNKTSPYVILPGDKLIVGFQPPVASDLTGGSDDSYNDGQGSYGGGNVVPTSARGVSLAIAESKIILYGYEITGEKENLRGFSSASSSNSAFLSETIGSPQVRDQFETHPRMTYYRSSLDEVVTGSMKLEFGREDSPQGGNVDSFTTDVQVLARQVVGRNSQGTQGKIGSLLRGRKASDPSEIYYDSMAPNLRELMIADGVRMIDITTGSVSSALSSPSIVLGLPGANAAYASFYDATLTNEKLIWDTWFQSYPFEARYANISRNPDIEKNILMPTHTPVGGSDKIGPAKRDKVSGVALALFDKSGDLRLNSAVDLVTSPAHKQLMPSGNTDSLIYNKAISSEKSYVTWRTNTYGDNDANLEPNDATATTAEMKITVADFANNNGGASQNTTADVLHFSLAGTVVNLGFDKTAGVCNSSNFSVIDDRVTGSKTQILNNTVVAAGIYSVTQADSGNWSSVGGPASGVSANDIITLSGGTATGTLGIVIHQAANADECAGLVKLSLDSTFSSNPNVTTSINGAVITITVTNRGWIEGVTPTTNGYVQPSSNGAGGAISADFMQVSSAFTGNDLISIEGALLKGTSVQKAVGNNDTKHLETVAFASILAQDQTNRTLSENLDINVGDATRNTSIIHELGSTIESDSSYYSKLFFGTGDGMFKSPTHQINNPSNVSLVGVDSRVVPVKHGFVSAPYNLCADFLLHSDDGFQATKAYRKSSSLKAWWRLDATQYGGVVNYSQGTSAESNADFTAGILTERTIVLSNGQGGFDAGADTLTIGGQAVTAGQRVLIKHAVNSNKRAADHYTVGDLTGTTCTLTRVGPPNLGGTCAVSADINLGSSVSDNTTYVIDASHTSVGGTAAITITLDSTSLTDTPSTPSANAITVWFGDLVAIQGDSGGSALTDANLIKILLQRIIKAVNGIHDSAIAYGSNAPAGQGIAKVYAQRHPDVAQDTRIKIVAESPGTSGNNITLNISGGGASAFSGGANAPAGTNASLVGFINDTALDDGAVGLGGADNVQVKETPAIRIGRKSHQYNHQAPNKGYSIGSPFVWDDIIGNNVASGPSGDNASIENSPTAGTGKVSIAMWIKFPTDSTNVFQNLINFGWFNWHSNDSYSAANFQHEGVSLNFRNNQLNWVTTLSVQGSATKHDKGWTATGINVRDGKWHHIVVTFDASSATLDATTPSAVGADSGYNDKTGLIYYIKPKFYVDGVEDTSVVNDSNDTATPNTEHYWGGIVDQQGQGDKPQVADCRLFGLSSYNGSMPYVTFFPKIDRAVEVAVWNDILDLEDVQALYASTCSSYINSEIGEVVVSSKFNTTGIGTTSEVKKVTTDLGQTTDLAVFTTGDKLVAFDSSTSSRQLNMIETVKAGQTVTIKAAAATLNENEVYGGTLGTAPEIITSTGQDAETTESTTNESLYIKVSTDGGTTWNDVTSITNALKRSNDFHAGTAASDSRIFASTNDNTAAVTDNMGTGAFKHGNTSADQRSGPEFYPSISFVAPADLKVGIQQPSNNGLAYDHVFFRYLSVRVQQGDATTVSDVFNTPRTGNANYAQQARAEKISIRGAKYGLISPVKLNTSAVFRAGSFGNPRDMLEQRSFTRTFNGTAPSEAPVQVKFLQRREKTVVSPEETNSANLDVFCTSSLPYFDGVVRDRTSLQPDLVDEIDVDIITRTV